MNSQEPLVELAVDLCSAVRLMAAGRKASATPDRARARVTPEAPRGTGQFPELRGGRRMIFNETSSTVSFGKSFEQEMPGLPFSNSDEARASVILKNDPVFRDHA